MFSGEVHIRRGRSNPLLRDRRGLAVSSAPARVVSFPDLGWPAQALPFIGIAENAGLTPITRFDSSDVRQALFELTRPLRVPGSERQAVIDELVERPLIQVERSPAVLTSLAAVASSAGGILVLGNPLGSLLGLVAFGGAYVLISFAAGVARASRPALRRPPRSSSLAGCGVRCRCPQRAPRRRLDPLDPGAPSASRPTVAGDGRSACSLGRAHWDGRCRRGGAPRISFGASSAVRRPWLQLQFVTR